MHISALLAAAAWCGAGVQASMKFAGVSVSSGEFGVYGNPGQGLPGTFGTDYQFINATAIDIQIDQGINLFRIAFLLERMCPVATGLGATFNETHFTLYQEAVEHVTDQGAYVLFDPHNYMRYNDPSKQPSSGSIIGDTTDPKAATTADFGAFWGEMAKRFIDNPYIIFGLVNEPHDMDSGLLLQNNQAAIDAIRAAGAIQMISAPSNGYAGGHAFVGTGTDASSPYFANLTDPLDNTVIEIHEYLDVNFSGQNVECVNSFESQLGPLTQWLKDNNMKALIAEFGGSNTTTCETMITDAIDYVATNDEYIGIAAWASGPFWNKYSPCCNALSTGQTNNFGSLEPGSLSEDGSPSFYDTLWLPVYLPKFTQYADTLQRCGASGAN